MAAVLVTGCDRGFGQKIAIKLAELNCVVFAGCATQEGIEQLEGLKNVRPLFMDVTSDEDVNQVVTELAACGLALKGVVNNAGISAFGYAECLPLHRYERNMSVNYFGTVRVTKACLPLLRKHKGRLVTIGSIGDRSPSAFGSAYISTKAAVASFHDCVRQEVYRFGIRCSLIEPGFFHTGLLTTGSSNGQEESSTSEELTSVYGSYSAKMGKTADMIKLLETVNGGERGGASVTDAVVDALSSSFPKAYYVVGVDANLFLRFASYIPAWIQDLVQTYL